MLDVLRKHPVITLIVVGVVVLLTWGFWPQPVLVEAAKAKRAPLTVTIEEEGRTRVIERYTISAPVDGVTCRVELNVGDPVTQGEALLSITPLESAVLDPRSRARARAQVAAAESALQAAQAKAHTAAAEEELAAAELHRLERLLDKGLVSRDSYDKAVAQAKTTANAKRSAEFSVEVARYEVAAARTALEYSAGDLNEVTERVPIRSPINGRILKVHHECKGPVRTGEALLEVGDPSELEIEVDVLSTDAVKIKPGMKVLFDRWGGERPLEGIVRTVEPVGFTKISALGVEEQRVLVISDFTSPKDQWQRLGDGYRVEGRFVLWDEKDVLQVPASSVFRYNDAWALFVIDGKRAVRREVQIGQRTGLVAQILEGVREGETVINHPNDNVEDGGRIKLR
jgi:HlyD family secretion protein